MTWKEEAITRVDSKSVSEASTPSPINENEVPESTEDHVVTNSKTFSTFLKQFIVIVFIVLGIMIIWNILS